MPTVSPAPTWKLTPCTTVAQPIVGEEVDRQVLDDEDRVLRLGHRGVDDLVGARGGVPLVVTVLRHRSLRTSRPMESRRPSPITLNDSTVSAMSTPGHTMSHGCREKLL